MGLAHTTCCASHWMNHKMRMGIEGPGPLYGSLDKHMSLSEDDEGCNWMNQLQNVKRTIRNNRIIDNE